MSFVYVMGSPNGVGATKIGVTTNLPSRLSTYKLHNPTLVLLWYGVTKSHEEALKIEKNIKKTFSTKRLGTSTEWFNCPSSDIIFELEKLKTFVKQVAMPKSGGNIEVGNINLKITIGSIHNKNIKNLITENQILNDCQKKVLFLLLKYKSGTQQSVLAKELYVSESTISRSVKGLINYGLVEKSGSTKQSIISLSSQSAWGLQPLHLRSPVFFDESLITRYIPNETQALTPLRNNELNEGLKNIRNGVCENKNYNERTLERFLIDLSFASSAMEGNTYNQLETEALIKYGEEAQGKTHDETLMILNHKLAISFLLENLDAPFNLSFANRAHTLLMRGLLKPKDLGVTRKNEARIGGSSYRPSVSASELRSGLSSTLYKADQIDDPFEAMVFLVANTSYVHHYEDGNKMMGRILANIPLLRKGLPPLSFVGINKADYTQGLLEYYERKNTSTLSNALVEGYLQAVHVYPSSHEPSQFPKRSELLFRKTIDEIMNFIISGNMEEEDIESYIENQIESLPNDNKKDIFVIVSEYLNNLTLEQGVLWDVSDQQVEDFLSKRTSKKTRKSNI